MMPQVQLRSFCSEEVWHPRTEVAKILVYGSCRTSGPTQKQLIGGLSKGDIGYAQFLLLIFFHDLSYSCQAV